ncbi:MAG: BT_3044 domain-containing protein [Dysgonomonas sp.]
MKFRNIIIIVTFILGAASCNQDEVFEKEQYKNVFALISQSDNVYTKFFDLRKAESLGYISFSMGGTNRTGEDVVINLVEDKSYIDTYNSVNFDMDVQKYIKPLTESKYDIESMQCKIPAGEIGGQIPVRIRPEGLSPDSSYFISVRVDSYSKYEINPEKNYLLYRIRIKNYWAMGDGTSGYNLRGKRKEQGAATGIEIPGVKIMHPLSANKVRIMAGTETYKSDVATFNKYAIVLEIADDNKVTITSYKDVEVTQMNDDTDFPNIFRIEDDGFKTYKTFLLRYNYKAGGKTYEMREELRLQFNPKDEKEDE